MALQGDFETIASHDGTKIACASWGEGPAVVLSNGICCSDTYWTYLVPYLVERGNRVVFFDYRGHHRSGRPENPNEVILPSHARDLWCVADALGVDDAVLVGHSMGVQTIFESYRLEPDRVRGLVALTGPFEHPLDHLFLTHIGAVLLAGLELTWSRVPTALRAVWDVAGLRARLLTVGAKALRVVSTKAPDDLMDEYFGVLAGLDPLLVIRFFRGMQMHSARDVLGGIRAPVLVLAGRRDVLTPLPVQRAMESLIPDVRFEVFDDASHTLPIDDPDRTNGRIREFLEEIGHVAEGGGAAPADDRLGPAPEAEAAATRD